MHDHARGLVDDHKRIVFVDYLKRHRFRCERELFGQQIGNQRDRGAEWHGLPDLRGRAIDLHTLRINPGLQAATRKLGKQARHDLVETLAGVLVGDEDRARRFGVGAPLVQVGGHGFAVNLACRVRRSGRFGQIVRTCVVGRCAWAIIFAAIFGTTCT